MRELPRQSKRSELQLDTTNKATSDMPYRLIHDTVSRNTVEALQTLLAGAENGVITGVAFVATLSQRRYITNVAGYCHRNPTFSRGMVAALDDKLRDLVQGRDPDETR